MSTHTIDIEPSTSPVLVKLGDTVLADTTEARVLHETGYPPRWYLPQADVRTDLLEPSGTVTHCPFKGDASYVAARIDGQLTDVAWTYPTALPMSQDIEGMFCFYDDRVDVLVDGKPL